MRTLGNLEGTLYRGDERVCYFRFEGGLCVELQMFTDDRWLLPEQFLDIEITEECMYNFLWDRITPPTRIGIMEDLAEHGVYEYDPVFIYHHNQGRSALDNYWIDFVDK